MDNLWAAIAVLVAGLVDVRFTLSDVGTTAVIGGLVGELAVRLARSLGTEIRLDGWREGMFIGALWGLSVWIFGGLGV